MKGFTLAPAAIHDLDEIYEYVASDSPAAADGVIDGIEQRANSLPTIRTLAGIERKSSMA